MEAVKICLVKNLKDIGSRITNLLGPDERFEILPAFSCIKKTAGELSAWQPEIVIMDSNQPGINTIEYVKKVKTLCPQSHFMIFTVCNERDKIFGALAAGGGYLLKKRFKKN
jgi:DNA-binding NarL/FixJ family response regulator